MRALVLSSSPRRDGNSAQLAHAVQNGLRDTGHDVSFLYADDVLKSFLRDCRQCRKADGECSIDDGFRAAFLDSFLPADGFIAATPIYWYGMSSQLKAFFDRMFCYVAGSYPESSRVVESMTGKRLGLVLSSEETFPTVSAGIVHQLQEYARYSKSVFVGSIHGVGNSRSDVTKDPHNPLRRAHEFGREFFTAHATDYQITTPRPGKVWG